MSPIISKVRKKCGTLFIMPFIVVLNLETRKQSFSQRKWRQRRETLGTRLDSPLGEHLRDISKESSEGGQISYIFIYPRIFRVAWCS